MLRGLLVSFMVFVVFSTVGEVDLLLDVSHDEVFVDGCGLVLMQNGVWLYGDVELDMIFSLLELGVLV